MSHEPYSVVADPTDSVYEDWTLKRVTELQGGRGWEVTGDSGMTCLVPALRERANADDSLRNVTPHVGDTLRVYGRFGHTIQGHVLNGVVIWYRDQAQREEHRRRELIDLNAAQKRRFDIERLTLDMRYERLPDAFKARIDRFRAADASFRVDSESYESFVLEQAGALLAAHFKTEAAVSGWRELADTDGYAEQERQAPPGWSDGHSGNTYGAAVRFAIALLRGEDV